MVTKCYVLFRPDQGPAESVLDRVELRPVRLRQGPGRLQQPRREHPELQEGRRHRGRP